VSKLVKHLLKSQVQIIGCSTVPVFVLESRFFQTFTLLTVARDPAPSYLPAKAISHTGQKSFERRTEMTSDRKLGNITGPVARGIKI